MTIRGNGRIFTRKGSSYLWIAYYHHGKEHREVARNVRTGEKIETSADKAQHQAEKFLNHRLGEMAAARYGGRPFVGPQQERITVAELLDALKEDYKLRGKWSNRIASSMKPIRDHFGPWHAVQVTGEAIDNFISELLRGDPAQEIPAKAPATVNRSTQLLTQAYKLAVRRSRLATAPPIRRLSEAGNARQGFLTETEFRTLLEHLPEDLKDFTLFAYLTGWRKGETASLRWEDVDGDVIRLRSKNSKNREGRTVPLVGELAELIARRKAARQVERKKRPEASSEFVFHRAGKRIGSIRKAWATACKFANVPGRLFHDLRRCAVRNMIRAGVPTDVARSISGHKTASIFSRYNIVAEDQKRDALERTQGYLRHAIAQQREKAVIAQQPVRPQ
jgi:integrase